MELIQKKIKDRSYVYIKGKKYIIARILSSQSRLVIDGRFYGYVKPEITVYRIHNGTILENTAVYVGTNYETQKEDCK
jgi:hypothetical protein